jgi:hypothetical protein
MPRIVEIRGIFPVLGGFACSAVSRQVGYAASAPAIRGSTCGQP